MKNIDETRNYWTEEINWNELMSKHKKIWTTLNYIEHFLILDSTVTVCVSISPFASLISISIGITSSAIGLKICAIIAGIIKKKKKKHDKTASLGKSKLNRTEVLTSKSLIDSNVSHDKFVSINNVLKEYEEMTVFNWRLEKGLNIQLILQDQV